LNAFYLRINRNVNSKVKLRSVRFHSLGGLDNVEENCVHICEDDNAQKFQSNGYTLFNIGTLVYKSTWHKKALELISHDLNNSIDIKSIMTDTTGQFCLIVHSAQKVFVITDKLGSFPVYKFEDNNSIHISNIFLLLARHNKVSMNYQGVAEYLSFDYCFDCTFFNEIVQLDRGAIYHCDSTLKLQQYNDYLSGIVFNKYNNLSEISSLTEEILHTNLSFLTKKIRIFADLTGGFDTRTNVTMLESMGLDFDTGICGEQRLHESNLGKAVAEILQVIYHSHIKITEKHVFINIANQHFKIGNGVPILYHSSELINYYEHIKKDFDIHITGFAGSQLFDQFIPRLSLLSSRLKPKSIFEKLLKFRNIMHSNLLSKTQYYDNLEKKIRKLFEDIGSDIHEEVATFFTLATFSKYYHGSLLGTHNIIMPVYSPFLEGNIAKLLIETSFKLKENRSIQRKLLTDLNEVVSLIMTTSGHNAHICSKFKKNPLHSPEKCVKNIIRRISYDFEPLLKLTRFIEGTINKVSPPVRMAEIDRCFWIDKVNEKWSDDMVVFEIVDRNKVSSSLRYDGYASKLQAKIIYLNRLIAESQARVN